jgi:small subunit ribosomal protein S6
MNNYELTIILEGKTTPAKKKVYLESLEKQVKLFKGKVGKVEDWGVKEMFHSIRKNTEGYYLIANLEMDTKAIKQLETKLRMDETILRHLIIKK